MPTLWPRPQVGWLHPPYVAWSPAAGAAGGRTYGGRAPLPPYSTACPRGLAAGVTAACTEVAVAAPAAGPRLVPGGAAAEGVAVPRLSVQPARGAGHQHAASVAATPHPRDPGRVGTRGRWVWVLLLGGCVAQRGG